MPTDLRLLTATSLAFSVVILVACRSHHAVDDASVPLASTSVEQAPETVVDVDTTRLAGYGLTLTDVEHALVAQHLRVEAREPSSFVVEVRGPSSPTIVLEIVIKVRDGVAIRISDVARLSITRPSLREPDPLGGAPR